MKNSQSSPPFRLRNRSLNPWKGKHDPVLQMPPVPPRLEAVASVKFPKWRYGGDFCKQSLNSLTINLR